MPFDTYEGSTILPNRIPADENGNPVAVQYLYHSGTESYTPLGGDVNGNLLFSEAPRDIQFQWMHHHLTTALAKPVTPVGMSMTGYQNMVIAIVIETSGSSVDLTPLLWNSFTGIYHVGPHKRFTESNFASLEVFGAEDVYLWPTSVIGDISVAVGGA